MAAAFTMAGFEEMYRYSYAGSYGSNGFIKKIKLALAGGSSYGDVLERPGSG